MVKPEDRPLLVTVVVPVLMGLRYWDALLAALRARGCAAYVVSVLSDEPPGAYLRIAAERAITTRVRKLIEPTGIVWFGPGVGQVALAERPGATVTLEYGFATFWCVLLGRLKRIPVWIFHEHVRPLPRMGARLERMWCRFLGRLATGVIANTLEAEEQAVHEYRIPARKVHRLWLLVPPRFLRGTGESEMPADGNSLRVGFLGQLIPRKGVDVLLRAVARARDMGAELHLSVAGDGPQAGPLARLCAALGLDDLVTFVGPLAYHDLGSFLAGIDLLVLPTRYDYRSVAVLEALAAGVPVITTTADGNSRSTVVDGRNGFIVPPDDVEALAERLVRLSRDRALLARITQGARDTDIPTPDEAAEGLLKLLCGIGPAGSQTGARGGSYGA